MRLTASASAEDAPEPLRVLVTTPMARVVLLMAIMRQPEWSSLLPGKTMSRRDWEPDPAAARKPAYYGVLLR
jgi:hypothetical protein